jgi:hypothetical protein
MLQTLVDAAVISGGITGTAAQIDVLTALGTNLAEARESIFSSFATRVAALPEKWLKELAERGF